MTEYESLVIICTVSTHGKNGDKRTTLFFKENNQLGQICMMIIHTAKTL